MNETEQIIDRLTSTVERQDNDVNQLSQELIDELRAVEVAEVVNEMATNENEPVENVSEVSESLQLAVDQNQ